MLINNSQHKNKKDVYNVGHNSSVISATGWLEIKGYLSTAILAHLHCWIVHTPLNKQHIAHKN
jgi:hypothetical protein